MEPKTPNSWLETWIWEPFLFPVLAVYMTKQISIYKQLTVSSTMLQNFCILSPCELLNILRLPSIFSLQKGTFPYQVKCKWALKCSVNPMLLLWVKKTPSLLPDSEQIYYPKTYFYSTSLHSFTFYHRSIDAFICNRKRSLKHWLLNN